MYPVKKILTKDFLKQDIDQLTYTLTRLIVYIQKLRNTSRISNGLHAWKFSIRYKPCFRETSQLYLNKALCLYRLGDIRDGILCLEESLKVDLSNEAALIMLGKLKDRLKSMRDYTMSVYG